MKNMNLKSKLKCKNLLIVCSIALAIAIVISSVIFELDIFKYNTGAVTRISAKRNNDNEVELKR